MGHHCGDLAATEINQAADREYTDRLHELLDHGGAERGAAPLVEAEQGFLR